MSKRTQKPAARPAAPPSASRGLLAGLLLAATLLAALGAGGFWVYQERRQITAADGGELAMMMLGKPDAPVEIIEYASMTCNFCAAFHSGTLPQLKRDFIDTGKARLVFREFPLDARSTAATLLARCAAEKGGQKRFFGFVQVLFDQQRVWALAEDGYAALQEIARQGGFGNDEFAACMENRDLLEKLYTQVQHGEKTLRINSTPTFFINGERVEGNLPYREFRMAIEQALEASR